MIEGGVIRGALKKILFAVGSSSPWCARRLTLIGNAGVTTILNMHRVAPLDGSDYRPLDPRIFEEIVGFLHENFECTTFGGIGAVGSKKPKVIISFDDGYKDFLENAVPVLDRFRISCNQNVIPECIETGLPPLNVLAQDFVGKAPANLVHRLEVPGFGRRLDKRSGFKLSHFIKNRSYSSQKELREALLPQFFEWQEFQPTAMMTLREVQELAGAHEIGAHSYAHASMEFETRDFVTQDVIRCRHFFTNSLGLPMDIYAFPNGSCTESQVQAVLDSGVKHVLLVGENFDRGKNVHKRFTFDGLSTSEARFKALGGLVRIKA